jgi:hypothetical protein
VQDYLTQRGGSSAQATHQALGVVYQQALRAGSAWSYLDGFRVMAILMLLAVPFVWIMKKPQFKSPGAGGE